MDPGGEGLPGLGGGSGQSENGGGSKNTKHGDLLGWVINPGSAL
jgi:hypothetical protein